MSHSPPSGDHGFYDTCAGSILLQLSKSASSIISKTADRRQKEEAVEVHQSETLVESESHWRVRQ